ncbi:hypothetical protein FB451DRAFT_1521657 [Mycena latifolia]|nr:hypothetical protein FB451DRAFT_1521657 [Mycena latifolia]
MRWDPSLGPRVPEPVVYRDWRPSVPGTKKRKTTDSDPRNVTDEPNAKRKKIGGPQVPEGGNERRDGSLSPVGLVWDNRDHSCAYDATLTILNNLWAEDTHMWTTRYSRLNDMMARYALNLNSVARNISTLEQARDGIRRIMHESNATNFPYGPNTTSIDRVASALFPERTYGTGKQSCPKCGFNDPVEYKMFEAWMTASLSPSAGRQDPVPISNWMAKYLTRGRSSCPSCRSRRIRSKMVMLPRLNTVPPILLIDINNDRLKCDKELGFNCDNSLVKLRLRGIIYGGQSHFTCRFIDKDSNVWFQDGISTGRRCVRETNLTDVEDMTVLQKCGRKKAVAVIYARPD